MARLDDINPQATRFTDTMCPGTDVYMPPEAVQDRPVYTEKIDCFSFGVITVQILTRQFPKPGDRLQEVELTHPGLPKRKLLMQIPEVERRQNHISQIPPNHSLLSITLDCLKDEENERPSAHQLCERVADLKGMPKYIDSTKTLQDKDEVIQSLTIHLEENERTKEEEIQHLRQQLQQERDQADRQLEERERQLNQQLRQLQQESDQALQENRIQLQERERQLGLVNQQLEASEQVVAQFERQIAEFEQQLINQREQQKTKVNSRGKELTSFKLRWREGKSAPSEMVKISCDAIVYGNTVYLTNGDTVKFYAYDTTSDSWSQLPDCVHERSSIAIINGLLTTVGGGRRQSAHSNELFSLTVEKGSSGRWTKIFPPMPTKRRLTTALCTGTTLIIAGGFGEDGRVLSTVEVMNTENHQWSSAADLPEPMYRASIKVCGDHIYVLGRINEDFHYIKSVFTCSVSALLQSCVPTSLEAKLGKTSLIDKASVWRRVADLPVIRSTCVYFKGLLLAIGGVELAIGKATTAVHKYNLTTNSWEVISHMTTARYNCFTAVLPDNRLMVVGGLITGGTSRGTDTVELASVCN